MTGRISVPGISHGDRVLLTGADWQGLSLSTEHPYEVDDITFHRPVIYAIGPTGGEAHWFISEPVPGVDWSVTKVEP